MGRQHPQMNMPNIVVVAARCRREMSMGSHHSGGVAFAGVLTPTTPWRHVELFLMIYLTCWVHVCSNCLQRMEAKLAELTHLVKQSSRHATTRFSRT